MQICQNINNKILNYQPITIGNIYTLSKEVFEFTRSIKIRVGDSRSSDPTSTYENSPMDGQLQTYTAIIYTGLHQILNN
jgi:hypothetical protein